MDQPNPAAETRTAADADTPVQTQEEPVTRDTPEVAVTAAPDRAPQLRTSDQAGDSPPIAEDIARRVVAEERVRIASIYDAARKLAIETGIADDLVRRGITLDEARTVLIDRAAERDRAVETRPHIRTVVSTSGRSGAARWRRHCCTASIRIATRSANPAATGAATA